MILTFLSLYDYLLFHVLELVWHQITIHNHLQGMVVVELVPCLKPSMALKVKHEIQQEFP